MDRQLLLHVLPLEAMVGSGEPAGVVTEERGNARLQTGIAVGRWHRLLLANHARSFGQADAQASGHRPMRIGHEWRPAAAKPLIQAGISAGPLTNRTLLALLRTRQLRLSVLGSMATLSEFSWKPSRPRYFFARATFSMTSPSSMRRASCLRRCTILRSSRFKPFCTVSA
jgi:hypothetical protein